MATMILLITRATKSICNRSQFIRKQVFLGPSSPSTVNINCQLTQSSRHDRGMLHDTSAIGVLKDGLVNRRLKLTEHVASRPLSFTQ